MSRKRKDLINNRELIRKAFVKLINRHHRRPTNAEIARETKLSERTIKRHIKTLIFEPAKDPLRILTDRVLISIFKSCQKGNVQAQKLWLQLMEGWFEKSTFEVEEVNPYEEFEDMSLSDLYKEEVRLLKEKAKLAKKPADISKYLQQVDLIKELLRLENLD